ncbi:MAG: M17 family peptidase N-terminal domain-containing protein [candidate division NC10 bacterium]|nr:M17 family peptidase N-terminal domain-containing protein [candidate division NC10 bacterium]
MKIQVLDSFLEEVPGEVLVLFHFEDQLLPRGPLARVDWILNGLVSRVLSLGKFSGHRQEFLLLSTSGKFSAERALVLGLGRRAELTWGALLEAYSSALSASARMKAKQIGLTIPEEAYASLPRQAGKELMEALLVGTSRESLLGTDLRLAFYEKEPARANLLLDILREGLPHIGRRFATAIQLLEPSGNVRCAT